MQRMDDTMYVHPLPSVILDLTTPREINLGGGRAYGHALQHPHPIAQELP